MTPKFLGNKELGLSPPIDKDGEFINISTGQPYTDDELYQIYLDFRDECNDWIVKYLREIKRI